MDIIVAYKNNNYFTVCKCHSCSAIHGVSFVQDRLSKQIRDGLTLLDYVSTDNFDKLITS